MPGPYQMTGKCGFRSYVLTYCPVSNRWTQSPPSGNKLMSEESHLCEIVSFLKDQPRGQPTVITTLYKGLEMQGNRLTQPQTQSLEMGLGTT